MQQIRTNSGARIAVEARTSAEEIAILKAARPLEFHEFVYTGNHRNGQNSGNYNDLEAWLVAAGLTIREDDLSIILSNLERTTGIAELTHRGKVLRYHAQQRQGEDHREMGYTYRVEYRLSSVR